MKLKTKELVLIAIFSAITAVLSQISIPIPFSPVPFSMQIIGVTLSGMLLEGKCAFLSQIIYILIGISGIPVFAGLSGGIQSIVGPTGGFIVSFPLIAFIIGYVSNKTQDLKKIIFIMITCMLITYTFGVIQLSIVTGMSLYKALIVGVLPFIVLDLFKIVFVSFIGVKIKKRYQYK